MRPKCSNAREAVRKWNALPRREDAQQIMNNMIVGGEFVNGNIPSITIHDVNTGQSVKVDVASGSLRQSDNTPNPSFVANWNKNALMTWDTRVGGHDWHTIFVFDGPRTYVVASCDNMSMCGMSRCNPKDEYNRNAGMREAVKNMQVFRDRNWKCYEHAFRVWINQFDPVWPKG